MGAAMSTLFIWKRTFHSYEKNLARVTREQMRIYEREGDVAIASVTGGFECLQEGGAREERLSCNHATHVSPPVSSNATIYVYVSPPPLSLFLSLSVLQH